jgi:hypothetical protein
MGYYAKTKLLYFFLKNSSYFLFFGCFNLKNHAALFCSTATKLLEPTLRTVERLLLYLMSTKESALMSTVKMDIKMLHVTVTQNCPASVPQMVPASLNIGEMILMLFVVGFELNYRYE